MNHKSIIFLVIALSAGNIFADETVAAGKKLYTTYCSACHGLSGGMDMSKRLAPPIIAVKMHYKPDYADLESFTTALVSWVGKPDESKTKMRGAIRRFKLMPAMPLPAEDLTKIAAYIYSDDVEKPEGFDEHYQQEHGKGMGKGKGKGKGKKKSN